MTLWLKIIAFILLNAQVKRFLTNKYATLQRREHDVALSTELLYRAYEESVILACVAANNCRAEICSRSIGLQDLPKE